MLNLNMKAKKFKILVNGEQLQATDIQYDTKTQMLTLKNGSKIQIIDKEVIGRIKQMINASDAKVPFTQDEKPLDLKNISLSFHDKIGR